MTMERIGTQLGKTRVKMEQMVKTVITIKITQDENNVYFELADGTTITNADF